MASFSRDAFSVGGFDEDSFDFDAGASTRRAVNARRRRRCAILLYRRFNGSK